MRRVVQQSALMLLLVGTASGQRWTAFSPEGGRCKVDMPGNCFFESFALTRS